MLNHVANLLVEQALGDRSLDRYLALLEVSLALRHDGVGHRLVVLQVGDFHLRQYLHLIGLQAACVHNFGVRYGKLHLVDFSLKMSLGLLCRVVF